MKRNLLQQHSAAAEQLQPPSSPPWDAGATPLEKTGFATKSYTQQGPIRGSECPVKIMTAGK